MKILHIITGLSDGGAEGALYRLAIYENKDTKHIVISLMDKGKYGDMFLSKNIEIHTLNMPRGKITWNGIKKLYKILKEIKPDIVQTWMYHADLIGGIVSKVAGIKNIVWGIRHTTHDKETTSFSTKFVTKLCAYTSHIVPTKIVSVSQKGVKVHQELGYKKDIFEVIPNGYKISNLNINNEARLKIRNEFRINDNQILVGMVGRYDPQKNHLGFIKAMRLLKDIDFKCFFVGTNCDNENEVLKNQIKNYNLKDKVILLGRRNDIPNIMNALDIHVLSSSYGEAFPNVLAEAMACGTPCITTDVGDAAYIVGDAGWVVKPSDDVELSNKIKEAIEIKYSNDWNKICLSARKRIEDKFTMEKVSKMYSKLWLKTRR